jgi:hypothetical protein
MKTSNSSRKKYESINKEGKKQNKKRAEGRKEEWNERKVVYMKNRTKTDKTETGRRELKKET